MEEKPPPPPLTTTDAASSSQTTTSPSSHQDHHSSHVSRRARHTLLLQTSSSFCSALLTPSSPNDLLSKYFIPSAPKITEHGPEWSRSKLPFLGKTFIGPESCLEYFSLLSSTLEMRLPDDAFPLSSSPGWTVDTTASPEVAPVLIPTSSPISASFPKAVLGGGEEGEGKGIVTVVGKGVFIAKSTRKEWSERFIYRFSGFDEEGRIGHWEIWADPLSAWVAVGGGEWGVGG